MSMLLSSQHTQGGKKFLNGEWNMLRKVRSRPAAHMHSLPECAAMLCHALHVACSISVTVTMCCAIPDAVSAGMCCADKD